MDTEQDTVAQVTAILAAAGFEPMPEGVLEGVLCKENGPGFFVFGGVHRGIGEVHSWDPGLSKRTTNDAVEAAHKLVAYVAAKMPAVVIDDVVTYEPPAEAQSLFGEPAEAAYGGDRTPEADTGGVAEEAGAPDLSESLGDPLSVSSGEEAFHAENPEADQPMDGEAFAAAPSESVWASDERDDGESGEVDAPIDADFAPVEDEPPERDALDADLIPLRGIAWDENTVADELGAEILDEGQAPQDRFIGLDDLDRRRSLRIGDVVRVSRAKQEAIWAASGTTEDAYQDLVSAVMRDTINGVYTGPATQFDQFTALQAWANQAHAVARAERGFVAFLTDATREQVESFNPEQGWPS